MNKPVISPRRNARRLALQALYQWEMTGKDAMLIISDFQATPNYRKVDKQYFKLLVNGVIAQMENIDKIIKPHLKTEVEELTMIEQAVLRLSLFELINQIEIPYRVIINEALELTKTFGTKEGFRFVNGVLDALARQQRPYEFEKKD